MAISPEQEMLTALSKLKLAREEYFNTVGLPVERSPPPASEAQVATLESRLGRRLPPSYRAFLLVQDGFPELDGEVNILCVDEMISIQGRQANQFLNDIATRSETDALRRCLIFGRSPLSENAYLFDPSHEAADGEWTVVSYDENEGVIKEYPNFTSFLISCAVQATEAKKDVDGGQDLADMDL